MWSVSSPWIEAKCAFFLAGGGGKIFNSSNLMKTLFQISLSTAALLLLAAAPCYAASPVVMTIPPGHYAKKMGNNTVKDSSGAVYGKEDVKGRVCVAIFITPNLAEGVKRHWAYLLADKPSTKLPNSVALVMIENIAAAGGFKKMPMTATRSDFVKGERPLTVLDYSGRVFKRFGISDKKTQILIFDKKGRLRDVESDLSDRVLTLKRIRAITAHLEKE